jgi:hypothetical protein
MDDDAAEEPEYVAIAAPVNDLGGLFGEGGHISNYNRRISVP